VDHLETEARNPASERLDELTALEVVRLMTSEDARVVPAVASQAEVLARAIEVIADRLRAGGYRIDVGEPTETIGKRIRAAELEKIPFTIVFGDRESDESLAIRERGGGQTQESLAEFSAKLATLAV
jgi:threonyl-tRNA synthetase